MKINLDKAFSLALLGLLIFNGLFHLSGLKSLIDPFNMGSVTTIFTTMSLIFLVVYLNYDYEKDKAHFLILSGITQLLSLGLLITTNYNSKTLFFQPSSLPTSLFILSSVAALFAIEKNLFKEKLTYFVGPLHLLACLFFAFAFVGKKLSLLGLSPQVTGVGLSFYTIVSFILFSLALTVRYTKIIHLYELKVGYQPVLGMIFVVLYATTNYLLTFCESDNVSKVSLFIQIFFIGASYWFFFRPFHALQDKFITICSWTRQIKGPEDTWMKTEEIFNAIGLTVTHGISEEHYKEIRANKHHVK